uniref:Uncharacterized protein n=1 Tax=Porprismacovirus sp. TaxID=2805938 RepID=A0A894JLN6_9VIRU|nr:hypothetical protein [Porprismacovirus sp.]
MAWYDDIAKNVQKFANDVGDWYGKTNKQVNDWVLDRYNNIRDVVNTYQDVLDDGIAPQDYKSWQSLLPYVDKIQHFQDQQKQLMDYFEHVGKYPAYTSRMPTFGSLNDLAKGIYRETQNGLYSVGKLSKKV